MAVYKTEEEQLEAIKRWWQKYSNLITIILSLFLLGFAGYKYWYWHQTRVTEQASTAYEQLMFSLLNQDNRAVRAFANQLTNNYSNTVYADAARLTLAKLDVNADKFDKAKENLAYLIKHASMSALRQIAQIRLSRILFAQKDYTHALAALTNIIDLTYMPLVNELKGDIYVATGQYKEAIRSYKEAMTEVRTNGMGNLFLEMKTNELAQFTQSRSRETNSSA